MSSRTYIQMALKLHNIGKICLPKEMLQDLEKYNTFLEKHPEAVEDVVKNRVKLFKYTNTIMPDVPILYVCHMIFEQDFLDSMFAEELGIKNYRVIGTSKATREEKIIKDNITKEEAEKFCELWGWSYDDGEHSYYLGYEAKYEENKNVNQMDANWRLRWLDEILR